MIPGWVCRWVDALVGSYVGARFLRTGGYVVTLVFSWYYLFLVRYYTGPALACFSVTLFIVTINVNGLFRITKYRYRY